MFLAANTDRVFARLLKAQDTDGIRALLALDVLDKAAFASAAALSAAPSLRALPLPPHPFKDSASVSSVPVWFPFLRQFYFA